MAIGPSDLLSALQNGVNAINKLNATLQTIFPQATVLSTAVPAVGAVTFSSSTAAGFLTVTTSSGATYFVPLY